MEVAKPWSLLPHTPGGPSLVEVQPILHISKTYADGYTYEGKISRFRRRARYIEQHGNLGTVMEIPSLGCLRIITKAISSLNTLVELPNPKFTPPKKQRCQDLVIFGEMRWIAMNYPAVHPVKPPQPWQHFAHAVVVKVFLALDARGFSAFDLAKDREQKADCKKKMGKLLIEVSISGWILSQII